MADILEKKRGKKKKEVKKRKKKGKKKSLGRDERYSIILDPGFLGSTFIHVGYEPAGRILVIGRSDMDRVRVGQ